MTVYEYIIEEHTYWYIIYYVDPSRKLVLSMGKTIYVVEIACFWL